MNGVQFFSKTNVPTSWNLASYHDPRSITWSWLLSFSLFRADEGRVWPLFWRYGDGWTARLPFVGFLRWRTQHKMFPRASL
jgi:hypothetical protein